ncbi:MAG: hypothetical protein N3H31_01205 [Candidatus Nezhaarchaeota archaeon]|nr:hypothetical protein [Candidatus Nezhaarchaeota archaeon]
MEIVVCSQCGYVLHKGVELVTPRDVVKKYSGKCPKCLNQLNAKGVRVQVRSAGRV